MGVMDEYTKQYEARHGEVLPALRDPVELERKKQEVAATEEGLVDGLRRNAARAVEAEAEVLEKVIAITDERKLPEVLRSLADSRTKSIDGLMKLTGRDQAPRDDGFLQTLSGLARAGLVKMNLDIGPQGEVGEDADNG